MKIRIKKKKINEISAMGGGAVHGHVNNDTKDEKEELEEMYSN